MFGSKGPRFHGNIWKSSVVSSVSIVAGEDACQCMSEKEIHFVPKILPIQNAPKRPTVLWELAPNPTQHLVCCLIFWWCQIFHWHYLQDEWHLLKERDLALFDTIGFATPPDSNPIDPPPRSYWGEFFASINDPPLALSCRGKWSFCEGTYGLGETLVPLNYRWFLEGQN